MKKLRSIVEPFLRQYWAILSIVAAFVALRVFVLLHDTGISWDASVYVGMGKYLFSHGAIGTWEALRPIGLPAVIGALWKLGLAPYAAGQAFVLAVSAAFLVVAYCFAERVHRNSGAIAATLLAASSFFFYYGGLPVTDVTSTFFAFLGLFLTYKAKTNRQYFIAGLVIALGFMFRFPQGLMLVVAMLVLGIKLFGAKGKKAKWNDRIVELIGQAFSVAGGFFAIVVPYLIANYYFYGNAFLPMIEGNAVIKQYPSLYQKEPWFYLLEVLKQNPLYVFAVAPIGMFWHKHYRSTGVIVVTTAAVVFAAYFTYQAHKEPRYLLAFLPYIAVLSAIGIMYLLERFRLPQLLFFGLFLIAAYLLGARMLTENYNTPDRKALYDFNSFLRDVRPGTPVMSATPDVFVYSDAKLTHNLYSDWNYAYAAYGMYKDTNEYILLNSCSLEIGCADNAQCMDRKQELLSVLAKNDARVFSATTSTQCVLSIYELRH